MTEVADYYQVLHVPTGASPEVIRKSFRALVRKHHPDRNFGDRGAAETTRMLIEAYQALSDPARRFAYDQLCQVKRRAEERGQRVHARQHGEQPPRRPAAPGHRRGTSYTGWSGISLAGLAQRMRAWNHLPQFIQGL